MTNRTFTDCHIYGPATIGFIGNNTLKGCSLGKGGLDEVLHEVVGDGPKQGIIGFLNCDFTRCTFDGVGVFGPKWVLDKIRENTAVI